MCEQDGTGVALLPATDTSHWSPDRSVPTTELCHTWNAWGALIAAAPSLGLSASLEPYIYDLINTGRECLAQLSSPLSQNFSDALKQDPLDLTSIESSGPPYVQLLLDLDNLLATDSAFLLGPWVAAGEALDEKQFVNWTHLFLPILCDAARAWDDLSDDCTGTAVGNLSCADFYEWNALVQLSTWYPTTENGELRY
jgi:hypothetical protein